MTNVLVEKVKDWIKVTINRPEKMNALNRATLEEIEKAFEHIRGEPSIRCVILTGAGEKSFVAGADISEFKAMTPDQAVTASRFGQGVFALVANCGKPVIAAVNGFALGGGCELAMSASLRIASETARFGLPEVTLGLIPGYGGTQRLPALVGLGRALQMMTSAEMIDASKALAWGLVNEVVPQASLLARCEELASKISANAPLAVHKCLTAAVGEGGFDKESELFGRCFSTADMKEGVEAFLNKRKPGFRGV
ncbi:MAG: enoyl-CoA hydratase/isomerase family protein [Planctomycetota bacterium]